MCEDVVANNHKKRNPPCHHKVEIFGFGALGYTEISSVDYSYIKEVYAKLS